MNIEMIWNDQPWSTIWFLSAFSIRGSCDFTCHHHWWHVRSTRRRSFWQTAAAVALFASSSGPWASDDQRFGMLSTAIGRVGWYFFRRNPWLCQKNLEKNGDGTHLREKRMMVAFCCWVSLLHHVANGKAKLLPMEMPRPGTTWPAASCPPTSWG